jgi:hypothetical protein
MSIVVLCPTRGRPARALQTKVSCLATKSLPKTAIKFAVDLNDPEYPNYLETLGEADIITLLPEETGNLVKATNSAVPLVWDDYDIIGHVGDDHLFRTHGWDIAISNALAWPGVAYGTDGHHGPNIPTACFLSSVIIKSLGWMALPTANHLYIDNAWKTLGDRLGQIHYLPGILIEHMHPLVGKAEMDEGYALNNSPTMYEHDEAAYRHWVRTDLADDVDRVRQAIG